MTWNLKDLRDACAFIGRDEKVHIERVDSIDRSIEIFAYHLSEAKQINDGIQPSTTQAVLELVLTPDSKKVDLWHKQLAVQANTQAALHNARSMYDLFSQLVNGLLLHKPIATSSCDINKVARKLEDGQLKYHLVKVLSSDEYIYISALVNTIKHRNLVSFGARVSFETGDAGIQFRRFKYRDRMFEPMWVDQVLRYAHIVKNNLVTAGTLVNDLVVHNKRGR